jgi:shikimate kinase
LDATIAQLLRGSNLYLIGMMGAGKTTVGKQLAQALAYRFFDTDRLIEQATGQAATQVFAASGEAVFREWETRTLAELAGLTRSTIATGGGIVLKPENWSYLRHGVVIWLDASLEVLQERLQSDQTRPLLQGSQDSRDLEQRLRALLDQRQHLYNQADLHIQVSANDTPRQITDRILQALRQACQEKAAADAALQHLNQTQPYQVN